MINRGEWQPAPDLWRKLKPVARQMRREPTPAEYRLWLRIRKGQICGVKFRRQVAIERFIVDFCSPTARLIVEVDGPIHEYTQADDNVRQAYLESLGFEVIRIQNADVLNNIESVAESIRVAVQRRLSP